MLRYLRTWLIIKRKQFLNFFPSKEKKFTKFAIVCAPRSGSTWLHTLLNSHPKIISYGEILRENHETNPKEKLVSIHELVFHLHHSSIKAIGLKLFYEYENDKVYQNSFNEIIKDKSIHIIHLVREDKSAQFKSLKRAEKTQKWSSGKSKEQTISVTIDPDELGDYQRNVLISEEHIDDLFLHHPLLKIKYEDLLSDQKSVLATAQIFLNVKPRKLFSLLKRQS